MHGANTLHISKPIFINLMLKELTNPVILLPVSPLCESSSICLPSVQCSLFDNSQACVAMHLYSTNITEVSTDYHSPVASLL